MLDELILSIGGKRLKGWKEFEVFRSIERGPHHFEVTLRKMQWRTPKAKDYVSVKGGDAFRLFLDDTLLISGNIDVARPNYDATTMDLTISGRSKLGDLVDCSTTGQKFTQQDLLQIATILCKPFGIAVHVAKGVDIGGVFASDQVLAEGQGVWEFLEYISRIKGVRLIGDAKGDLWLTRGPQGRAKQALTLGENVLSAGSTDDHRQRFSHYTVQVEPDDDDFGDAGAQHIQGEHIDKTIKRYRPITITTDVKCSLKECATQALWQFKSHYGRSRQAPYVVHGFRQAPGEPVWPINALVRIDDAYLDINEDRLIVSTKMTLNDKGPLTEVVVQPADAYDLQPLKEEKSESVF
jgi:prophage tail gpP-like protein